MKYTPIIQRKLRRLVVLCVIWYNTAVSSGCDDDDHNIISHNSSANRYMNTDDDDNRPDDHRHLDDIISVVENGEYCAFQSPSDDVVLEDRKKMELWWMRERSKPIFERTVRLYIIPVYFHVIQTSSTTGMVSDTRIRDFINYLNDSYSNSDVPFYFEYKGVTRTVRSDWDNCYDADIQGEFKPALKVGGSDTLNIYICNKMYNPKGVSVTGYSTGPTSANSLFDGVVINNDSGEARLNTLVHETGHFFGLFHTFGDNTCNAASVGDQVEDTPQHTSMVSQVHCHSDPSTWDTCPLLPGLDPNDNFMNYSKDVLCRTRFTQGQKERMIAQYELYRMVQPAPLPVPVARPVPRPVAVPRPVPVRRPVPRPVLRPVPRPRPKPVIAPKSVPVNATPKCANLLSRCSKRMRCCGGRTCRSDNGAVDSVFGGRCFFF